MVLSQSDVLVAVWDGAAGAGTGGTVDTLKGEAWQFFQLSGSYANMTYVQAYPAFAAHIEELSREEVETYMRQVAKEKTDSEHKQLTTP